MKISQAFLLVSTFCLGCSSTQEKPAESDSPERFPEIPEITVVKSALRYDHKTSLWLMDDSPYSGFAISYYSDSSLMEKIGIYDGKKQNKAVKWYPDRHFKSVSNYHKGKLHGEKKVWSTDSSHILLSHLNYASGQLDGEQKIWYPTGELFKKLSFSGGREDGLQQAYRKNGALFANYEAREGRIFGLKKAALCYSLEDEKIQEKK